MRSLPKKQNLIEFLENELNKRDLSKYIDKLEIEKELENEFSQYKDIQKINKIDKLIKELKAKNDLNKLEEYEKTEKSKSKLQEKISFDYFIKVFNIGFKNLDIKQIIASLELIKNNKVLKHNIEVFKKTSKKENKYLYDLLDTNSDINFIKGYYKAVKYIENIYKNDIDTYKARVKLKNQKHNNFINRINKYNRNATIFNLSIIGLLSLADNYKKRTRV